MRRRGSTRRRAGWPGPAGAAGILTGLVLTLAACGGGADLAAETSEPSPYRGSPVAGELTEPDDFALHDQSGQVVRLSDQRGKIVLVSFLYTHCPDVCPLTTERLNGVLRELGPNRDEVRVLGISVDPGGDTPEAVREFVDAHRLLPQFRYLTGTPSELEQVWSSFFVASSALDQLSANANPEALVDHTAYVLLVDQGGRAVVRYSGVPTTEDVLHDVLVLLG